MRRICILILALSVGGCGAEVVGTAAVVGKAKVEEAKQTQQHRDQIQQRLDAATELERQRRSAADERQ